MQRRCGRRCHPRTPRRSTTRSRAERARALDRPGGRGAAPPPARPGGCSCSGRARPATRPVPRRAPCWPCLRHCGPPHRSASGRPRPARSVERGGHERRAIRREGQAVGRHPRVRQRPGGAAGGEVEHQHLPGEEGNRRHTPAGMKGDSRRLERWIGEGGQRSRRPDVPDGQLQMSPAGEPREQLAVGREGELSTRGSGRWQLRPRLEGRGVQDAHPSITGRDRHPVARRGDRRRGGRWATVGDLPEERPSAQDQRACRSPASRAETLVPPATRRGRGPGRRLESQDGARACVAHVPSTVSKLTAACGPPGSPSVTGRMSLRSSRTGSFEKLWSGSPANAGSVAK